MAKPKETASPFMRWLAKRVDEDGPIGDLAGDVKRDPPLELNAYRLSTHMSCRGACPEAFEAHAEAVLEFHGDTGDKRVYFVGAPGTGLIKIGSSYAPEKRMNALQSTSPVRLIMLGHCVGSQKLEAFIHRELKAHRSHGEWFWWNFSVLIATQHHTGACLSVLCDTMGEWRDKMESRRPQRTGVSQ